MAKGKGKQAPSPELPNPGPFNPDLQDIAATAAGDLRKALLVCVIEHSIKTYASY